MALTSSFGWLDFDESERRRVLELVDLFREKGTLDELGLGTIRDTFADHFFPGVSTIQTRARYFLFIPWIYLRIDAERVPASQVDRRARDLQYDLVQSLSRGGESSGVIGVAAGRNIQRPPSTIYWLGLRRWGIRLFDRSDQQYHAVADPRESLRRRPRRGENDELLDGAHRAWHGGLPAPPPDLFDATTFNLTGKEAMYLLERVQHACGDTLLAACVARTVTGVRTAAAPWQLGGTAALPPDLQDDLRLAEFFSLGMEGAVLLYNLMLAEAAVEQGLAITGERVDGYRSHIARWADEVFAFRAALDPDAVAALRARLLALNPRIPLGALQFCTFWLEAAVADPRGVADNAALRDVIRRREHRLKGSLARLANPRALETWSGASGLGRLGFRWPNARRIIMDIHEGLRQGEGIE